MRTGTICDLDSKGEYGLIDGDDGHIVCFNRGNVESKPLGALKIGMRVEFSADYHGPDVHATAVRLSSSRHAEN